MTPAGRGGIAGLPMYDHPAVRGATDALWVALREALRAQGVAAPDDLSRDLDPWRLWTAPDLVLAQTCGLPYATRLRDRVRLVGAPAFALEGCPPGHYRSALVVAADAPWARLADLRGRVPAINACDSQSGYAALLHASAPFAEGGRFFAAPLITGAHAASAAAVADARADVAALDAVTWQLLRRHDRVAERLRVIGWTAPTPGLPYVTALADPDPLAVACAEAIHGLDAASREALLLTGFTAPAPEDYAAIPERLAAAERVHTLPEAPVGRA